MFYPCRYPIVPAYSTEKTILSPLLCTVSSVINQTFSVHGAVSRLNLLFHQSVCPALYQNNRIQMSLNSYWPRLCSLGIRRLKVGYSHISKDLENQLEKPEVSERWGTVFPSMSGVKRERFLGGWVENQVGSQHGSMRLTKEHRDYWGVQAEITGAWMKEKQGGMYPRDTEKRKLRWWHFVTSQ